MAVAGLAGAVVPVAGFSLIRVPIAWSGGILVPAGRAVVAAVARLRVSQVGRLGMPWIAVAGPEAIGPATALPSSAVRPAQAAGKGPVLLAAQIAARAAHRWPA
jgi:hypothetical protein